MSYQLIRGEDKKKAHKRLFFDLPNQGLLIGDDEPHYQIEQETRNSPGQQGDEERQAEPKCTDAKEICQASADPRKNTVGA